jgi:hypothetical protein
VWHYMLFRRIDLRVILWPSSVILTVGWFSTTPGILTTMLSVAINCLFYVAVALSLRACIHWGKFGQSILATSVSALSAVVLWNTALVLTGNNICVVLLTLPYTNKTFIMPRWFWGPIPVSVFVISTLCAAVLWTKLIVSRVRTLHSIS